MNFERNRKRTNKRIFELIGLIAGTSAGAYIASGVVISSDGKNPGSTLEEIEQVYTRKEKELFSPITGLSRYVIKVTSLFRPAFGPEGMNNVLKEMAADLTLKSCLKPIFVPAFDINNNETVFFKTRHALTEINCDIRIFDICRATSAAPTYFAPYRLNYLGRERAFVDGGVFMNNPSMGALAEASKYKSHYGIDNYSDISVLSIGTGSLNGRPHWNKSRSWGQLDWLIPITGIMMQGV